MIVIGYTSHEDFEEELAFDPEDFVKKLFRLLRE